jgi:hypothetical protein
MRQEEAARWTGSVHLADTAREGGPPLEARDTWRHGADVSDRSHRRGLLGSTPRDQDGDHGLGAWQRMRGRAGPDDREARQRQPQPANDVMQGAGHARST